MNTNEKPKTDVTGNPGAALSPDTVAERREILRSGALLGGACLAALLPRQAPAQSGAPRTRFQVSASDYIYSTCLQCNTGCEIKVRIQDGIAVKIDGNPYGPRSMDPHIDWATPAAQAAKLNGIICPKGQAGVQTNYDPYRVVKVLKRAGKRGEGRWTTISFDQAITEIVNGGALFPQDGDSRVTGLRDLYALRDPAVFSAMAADVSAIQSRRMTVAEFKEKHKANLDKLIDPDHPDFGPINNQFVFNWGRLKGGRSEFFLRFVRDSFGSANAHGHTTVCQGSLYFASKAMSEQYDGTGFKDGQKFYWQVDQENAEYILFVGANLFEANYGPTNRTSRMTDRLVEGKLKFTVLDPRYTKLASKGARWVPVKPGTDAAFAMGMTRWILENKRYDAKYLENANKAAAAADKEPTWSNGPWLVKLGKDGEPTTFLRAHEIGLKPKEVRKAADGKESEYEWLVVVKDGKAIPVDPNDDKNPVEGDLFVTTEFKDEKGAVVRAKSSLQVMLEAAQAKTLAEWAKLCGTTARVISDVAKEFTSHGKKAGVDMHRGPAQHTNGFYNISALMNLNLLIGNFDWTGGMIAASTFNVDGSKTPRQPYPLAKITPKTGKPFGLSIIRHDAKYEESTVFAGYPAKRNWWPLASDVYEEILPSMQDAYPYPIKVLFSYMGTPGYALPAGHTQISALLDLEKIPLYFASDITVGTTSLYADYIFPDLHYLERWEFQGSHPNMPVKVQPVRQPVIASPNEVVKVFGEDQPISLETVWLALAEKLGLPGFGKDAFGPGKDLARPDDFYLRLVANLAHDGKESVPDASSEDLQVFQKSRRHLPRNVFDAARWASICGESWKKAVFILTRGGRFDTQDNSYKGDHVANKYAKQVNLYQEKTYKVKDAFTGKHFLGLATFVPIADTLGNPPDILAKGHDLHLVTQRDVRMTKSRTITNSYLTALYPENAILVHTSDAKRLGFRNGQKVKVVSATNPEGTWNLGNGRKKAMVGKIEVTETLRPGVITFTLGHGHWATGAMDMVIDGQIILADPHRQGGIHANAAMWVDPYLKNTCMIDKVGGSVSFYDTKVRLVKA